MLENLLKTVNSVLTTEKRKNLVSEYSDIKSAINVLSTNKLDRGKYLITNIGKKSYEIGKRNGYYLNIEFTKLNDKLDLTNEIFNISQSAINSLCVDSETINKSSDLLLKSVRGGNLSLANVKSLNSNINDLQSRLNLSFVELFTVLQSDKFIIDVVEHKKGYSHFVEAEQVTPETLTSFNNLELEVKKAQCALREFNIFNISGDMLKETKETKKSK